MKRISGMPFSRMVTFSRQAFAVRAYTYRPDAIWLLHISRPHHRARSATRVRWPSQDCSTYPLTDEHSEGLDLVPCPAVVSSMVWLDDVVLARRMSQRVPRTPSDNNGFTL